MSAAENYFPPVDAEEYEGVVVKWRTKADQ